VKYILYNCKQDERAEFLARLLASASPDACTAYVNSLSEDEKEKLFQYFKGPEDTYVKSPKSKSPQRTPSVTSSSSRPAPPDSAKLSSPKISRPAVNQVPAPDSPDPKLLADPEGMTTEEIHKAIAAIDEELKQHAKDEAYPRETVKEQLKASQEKNKLLKQKERLQAKLQDSIYREVGDEKVKLHAEKEKVQALLRQKLQAERRKFKQKS